MRATSWRSPVFMRAGAVSVFVAAPLVLALGCGSRPPETLAIGAAAPAFSLPGIDGKTHSSSDYAASPVLVVVFTCNHCPVSQLYEQRIQQLHRDYRDRGVAVVAINPDSEKTIALKDLAYSDVPDSLDGMTERARHRRLEYPYLYDGDAQKAAVAFKVVATPQVFVFDSGRTLQYVGRIDDNLEEKRVKVRDVRVAIDALLARQPVKVATTPVPGCPLRRAEQTSEVKSEQAQIAAAPINLKAVLQPELKALRANAGSKLMIVNFWATWCGPCITEFPELQTIYRTYRSRNLEYVTVSIDAPEAEAGVLKMLKERRASSRNYIFAIDDTAALQEAFDPALPASVPFTLLIGPTGDVLHQQHGTVHPLTLRRAILANLPEDPAYPGLRQYWATE